MNFKQISLLLLISCFFSCGDDPLPKPKAYLRLEYPEAKYIATNTELPFSFEKNMLATDITNKRLEGTQESYGLNIEYSRLKGTIYLTYKKIRTKDNLRTYLRDAQNFTQEHTKKADEIIEQVFEDTERNVYGMFYEVGGNAASQSQFYVTDSVKHFLIGSLYFYAKPNYDSILPAAAYLKKDIKRIMETIKWKE
jgi:gliding motility-associated lipoprotein GldD